MALEATIFKAELRITDVDRGDYQDHAPFTSVLGSLRTGAVTARARARESANLERVFTLFPILKSRARQLAGTLSGGEQQMLTIGRALMAEPTMLMIDEPSLGLAPLFVKTMFEVVQSIRAQGVTVLL
jgi:branched-chain amino acid transport system ATP-binding protein